MAESQSSREAEAATHLYVQSETDSGRYLMNLEWEVCKQVASSSSVVFLRADPGSYLMHR